MDGGGSVRAKSTFEVLELDVKDREKCRRRTFLSEDRRGSQPVEAGWWGWWWGASKETGEGEPVGQGESRHGAKEPREQNISETREWLTMSRAAGRSRKQRTGERPLALGAFGPW